MVHPDFRGFSSRHSPVMTTLIFELEARCERTSSPASVMAIKGLDFRPTAPSFPTPPTSPVNSTLGTSLSEASDRFAVEVQEAGRARGSETIREHRRSVRVPTLSDRARGRCGYSTERGLSCLEGSNDFDSGCFRRSARIALSQFCASLGLFRAPKAIVFEPSFRRRADGPI